MKQIEIIDKRKLKEKHFMQEDGTFIAEMYEDNVHYLKDGQYVDIDNTLVLKDGYYINKANDYKVSFNASANSNLMKIEKDNHFINIGLKEYNSFNVKKEDSMSKLMSKIKYTNVLKNIDICYDIVSSKVKENIYIKNKDSEIEKLVFVIDTDLDLELNTNGSVSASIDENLVFNMDAPYMFDSTGLINKNVKYELNKIENKYELKMILDKEWLDSDVKYPIVIDPTITNSGNNNNVYDTYIYPGDTNIDRNSQEYLKVGVERINGNDVVNRALLKFELPTIGTGSQIVNADLTLRGYPDFTDSHINTLLDIHRITQDWNETTANWNSMNDKYTSRIEGVFESTRSYYTDNNNQIHLFMCGTEITSLVKKWYSDTPNYGIMIKANKEVYKSPTVPIFFSKNNNMSGGNPKPILSITYRNQNGVESYMNYKVQSFSQGNTYHNTYNGNLTSIFDIGCTKEGKLPSSLKLVYNTNDVVLGNDIGYGLGYRYNLSQTIKEVTIDNINYLEYTDEDGTIHYFLNQKTRYDENNGYVTTTYENTYFDEDGLELIIEKNSTNYVLKDKEKNEMTFTKINNVGYLTQIRDVSLNVNTITYDSNNKIINVIDADNQEINITYGTNIITIVSPDQTVVLNYADNNLSSIVSLVGTTTFTNQNNLITSITDVNGLKTTFEYYEQSPYRIKKILEYGLNNTLGNYYETLYGFNVTKITDSKNRVETITYNDYGNVSSISGLKVDNDITNAYGIKLDYGESNRGDTKYKNRLLDTQIPLKYVKNYINNSSFESNNTLFSGNTHVTVQTSTDYANSGFQSLKMQSTNDSSETAFYSVNVPKGEHYTFSAYLKTDNMPIKISLGYIDENNETVEVLSDPIVSQDDFERFDVSIYYSETAISNLIISVVFDYIGTYYMDDIQLEQGEVANNYNMFENSNFENGTQGWTMSAQDEDGHDITSNVFEVVNLTQDTKALKVKLNPSDDVQLSQTFNVKGQQGDKYTISFWYKSEGFPGNYGLGSMTRNNVTFQFHSVEEQATDFIPSQALIPNESTWQYFSHDFIAPWDFEGLTVEFLESLNANDFYISNLSLFKDVRSVVYDYDDNGNIILKNDLNNQDNKFDYDANNQLIKMMDPKGNNLVFEYDNNVTDRVLRGVTENGISNEIDYDLTGDPIITRTINRGQVTDVNNGSYKIRLKGTNSCLRLINGNIAILDDICGHDKWILEKETIDNIDYFKIKHSIITSKYVTVTNNNLELASYSLDNSLFKFIKQKNGSYIIQSKSNSNYLKYENNVLILSTLVEADEKFEFYLESITNSKFIENSAEYTSDGKYVKSVLDSNFNKIVYDIDSLTGLVNSITNANGKKIYYYYDNNRRISSIIDGERIVNYQYDQNQQLSKISQNGREYNFVYDEFLNLNQMKIGNNIILSTNNYEINNGNLSSVNYGNNDVISYEYDDFDRIKKITKMDNIYQYKYGNNGDLMKVVANDYIEKFIYDLSKRLYEYKYNDFKVTYKYDSNDNIINRKYKLNNIIHENIYTLDNNDNLEKVAFNNNEFNYSYDDLGRIVGINHNNFLTNYEYCKNGERTSMLVRSVDNNGDKYSYRYDKLNNITHIYHNDVLENQYYYDEYNQLIKENNYILNQTIRYKYDKLSNLLYKKTYELNTYNQLSQNLYNYGNLDWKDQLTKFNGEIIMYDAIGNPVSIGNNITLNWVNGRQLNTYEDLNQTITYNYNQDGIRTKKTINGIETDYYLEGKSIVLEKTGNNVLYYLYSSMSGLLGFKYNNDYYYYIKNNQDDVIGIVDSNNNIIAKYVYDSWGNILSIKDGNNNDVSNNLNHIANINPFRYRSYYYDKEINVYYLNNRYYNPVWGRFLNSDSIICSNQDVSSYNLYAYCSNNPVNLTDHSGEGILKSLVKLAKQAVKAAKTIVKAVAKKVASSVKSTVSNIVNSVLPKITTAEKKVTTPLKKQTVGINDLNYTTGATSSKKTNLYGEGTKLFKNTLDINSIYPLASTYESSVNIGEFSISREIGFMYQKSSKSLTIGNKTYSFETGFDKLNFFIGFSSSVDMPDDVVENYYGRININVLIPLAIFKAATSAGPVLEAIKGVFSPKPALSFVR